MAAFIHTMLKLDRLMDLAQGFCLLQGCIFACLALPKTVGGISQFPPTQLKMRGRKHPDPFQLIRRAWKEIQNAWEKISFVNTRMGASQIT